jgi:DNA-binding transcriptional MerR regulator
MRQVLKENGPMSSRNGQYITAKDISKRFKVAYPTINHYTNLGFLSIVKREGNKRIYSGKEVKRRLEMISRMVNEGYPLRLIRSKLVGKGGGLA